MAKAQTIYFAVTNDLTYDQRMQRICTALAGEYRVILVGRKMKNSIPLSPQPFIQKRLYVPFQKGKAFYIFYNLQLFFYLVLKKMDAICAIDLDTILPCYFVSYLKKKKRVYDAHELFTELVEVVSRPKIHRFWLWVERYAVPKFLNGYTVNQFIANAFKSRYGVSYQLIRNLPFLQIQGSEVNQKMHPELLAKIPESKFFLYQGAVNEGRCFETLIPAMKHVDAHLVIAGNGNFLTQTKQLIKEHSVGNKVVLLGAVTPQQLRLLTPKAYYGLTLFTNTGLNQYHSLANRFFDYVQGHIPQVCVAYPEYVAINKQYHVACLIHDISETTLSQTLNKLLQDDVVHNNLKCHCEMAAKHLNWEMEKDKLMAFYQQLLK